MKSADGLRTKKLVRVGEVSVGEDERGAREGQRERDRGHIC